MVVEKNLRGVLRSEVDRSVSRDSIIIVDSLNNIKGYQYELWCLARASGVRYCVLFCDTEVDHCREWNSNRQEKEERAYDSNIFEDLVRRFEKPDRRNRWDSPLFELFPSRGANNINSLYEMDKATQEVVNAVVEAQSCGLELAMNKISIGPNLPTINLQRSVGLPELRSLRRTFIKLAGQYSLSGSPPPTDADSAKRMFVDYLNSEVGA
ncbi:protein KTI12 homolog isoform X2 [Setaria italica]|nr:protein KTI12 homolog isoform X2 [Setaria italica]